MPASRAASLLLRCLLGVSVPGALLLGPSGCGSDDAAGGPGGGPLGEDSPEVPADEAAAVTSGYVSLNQSNLSSPIRDQTASATASFRNQESDIDPGLTCTEETVGACTLRACLRDQTKKRQLVDVPQLDAGEVRFVGTVVPVVLKYQDADQGYSSFLSLEGGVYKPGATIQVVATGGADVPAFAATVTVPQPLTVTKPTGFQLSVRRDQPYEIAWTGGAGGPVHYGVESWSEIVDQKNTSDVIDCVADGAAGGGTVPAELMKKIRAGSNLLNSVNVTQDQVKRVRVGAFQITFRLDTGIGLRNTPTFL